MIKVKRYEVQTVAHYDPDGNFLGFLNEAESTDLRLQIARHGVSGYYLAYCGEKLYINEYGRIDNWPAGLYDTNEKLITELLKTQMERNKASIKNESDVPGNKK